MEWTNRLTTIGGGLGAIMAKILSVSISQVAEIAVYALVGSLIGEGVKELIKFVKTKSA